MSYPQELMERKQWVNWRRIPDKDGGRDKKMPYNPITGKGAQSNNPATWTDYATAADALERLPRGAFGADRRGLSLVNGIRGGDHTLAETAAERGHAVRGGVDRREIPLIVEVRLLHRIRCRDTGAR